MSAKPASVSSVVFEVPVYLQSWSNQTTWYIDPSAGDDNNNGATSTTPLKTFAEWRRRMPSMSRDTTINIVAGAVFPTTDPMVYCPIDLQADGSAGFASTLTIVGTRTLTLLGTVSTSSDVITNAPAKIDLGVTLTPGNLIQATSGVNSGATAVVLYLVSGTNYATSQWRAANGNSVVPPVAGATVSKISLPTNPLCGFSHSHIAFQIQNIQFASMDNQNNAYLECDTCIIPGYSLIQASINVFMGCSITGTALQANQAGSSINLVNCGLTCGVRTVNPGAVIFLTRCTIAAPGTIGVEAADGGYLIFFGTVGIYKSSTTALDVHNGGQCDVGAALFGDNSNAGKGTRVRDGGQIRVITAITPTLAATGQELELENAGSANPTSAGIPQAAQALTTWATWAGGTFNRSAMSYTSGACIATRA
jgi:hypothetical protein